VRGRGRFDDTPQALASSYTCVTVSSNLGLHRISTQRADYAVTLDRRYFAVRGHLWRLSNPCLNPEIQARLVQELMAARRAVLDASDSKER
jgi:hypothetical protein